MQKRSIVITVAVVALMVFGVGAFVFKNNVGEPPPIKESISGVNPDKLWATLRRHINGTEAIHGGADYRAFAAG